MQRSLPITIAVLLAACGAAVTSTNDAAESATQKNRRNAPPRGGIGFQNYDQGGMAGCFDPNLSGYPRAAAERAGGVPCDQTQSNAAGAQAGDGWAGHYAGQFDGGRGEFTITGPRRVGFAYDVRMSVAGGGCSGEANGSGDARGNVLTFAIPTGNQVEGAGLCQITLRRNGNVVRVSEDGCMELHGMSCEFSGSATRLGGSAAASQPRAATASAGSPWIVGAWVGRGERCGGEGWVINTDGTYYDTDGSGRWSLSGNALTATMLRRVTEDADMDAPVRSPRAVHSQIVSHDARSMSVRFPNGRVVQFVRCR